MLDTVDFNHVQHISFTQSLLTDAVSVILSELLSYEHPPNVGGLFSFQYAEAPSRVAAFLLQYSIKQLRNLSNGVDLCKYLHDEDRIK